MPAQNIVGMLKQGCAKFCPLDGEAAQKDIWGKMALTAQNAAVTVGACL